MPAYVSENPAGAPLRYRSREHEQRSVEFGVLYRKAAVVGVGVGLLLAIAVATIRAGGAAGTAGLARRCAHLT